MANPAKLTYVCKASALADAALTVANRTAEPRACESDILAAMQGAIFKDGSDYPGKAFIIGLGPNTQLCCNFTGWFLLDTADKLAVEFAIAYPHYYYCLHDAYDHRR